MLDEAVAAGYPWPVERLSGAAARRLEPAFSDGVVGGFHVPAERYVRPESVADGLAAWLRANGAEVREGVEVARLERRGPAWRVGGELEAEAVVVAAGIWSTRLLGPLGIGIPMEAAKGYSITARGPGTLPSHALYLAEAKVGTSTYDGGLLRIAGVFDLTGMDESLRRKRVEQMVAQALPFLRDWRPAEVELEWSGLRPYPSDGLPVIGPTRHPGLVVATGHGRMGITLAPATGDAVARLVLEGVTEPGIAPFGLERF
jgi:D-amino-acid dehydrogenase